MTTTNHFLTREQTQALDTGDMQHWNASVLPAVILEVDALFAAQPALTKVFVRSLKDAKLVDIVYRETLANH